MKTIEEALRINMARPLDVVHQETGIDKSAILRSPGVFYHSMTDRVIRLKDGETRANFVKVAP